MEPFDTQRPTVPLWKVLEPFVNIVSAQETGSILKIGFVLSNLPHFDSTSFIAGSIFFAKAVVTIFTMSIITRDVVA